MDFQELKSGILSCRLCWERFGFEPRPVFFGNADACIVQISQAPSKSVSATLKPFDDAGGRKLRKDWYKISDEDFYDPSNFYMTCAGHCYPGKAPGGGDRLPPAVCAKKWLFNELEAVSNKIYIIIGRKAAELFFKDEEFTSLVFADKKINGRPAYILPHPSPLNVKWFKENPRFLRERVKAIENAVHEALGI